MPTMQTIDVVQILTDAIAAPTTGASHGVVFTEKRAFQAVGSTSAGAGTSTIQIQASLNDADWFVIGTITLLWTAPSRGTDGFTTDAPWAFIRAVVTAISGTDASIDVYMGG